MDVSKTEKQRDYALYSEYCLKQVASAPDQDFESCCAKWPQSRSTWPTERRRKTRWWPHRQTVRPTDTPKPDRSLWISKSTNDLRIGNFA